MVQSALHQQSKPIPMHELSATTMSKKRSNNSTLGPNPNGTSVDQVRSLSASDHSPMENALDMWRYNADEPFNPYKRRASSGRQGVVPCKIIEDPSTFTISSVPARSTAMPASQNAQRARACSAKQQTRPTISLPRKISNASQTYSPYSQRTSLSNTPATPFSRATDALTTPTSAPLSRECSSLAGDFFTMMRMKSQVSDVQSNASFEAKKPLHANSIAFPSTGQGSFDMSIADMSQIADHAGTFMDDMLPAQFDSASPTGVNSLSQPNLDEDLSNSTATSLLVHPRKSSATSPIRAFKDASQSSEDLGLIHESIGMSRTSSSFGSHQVVRQRSADGQVKELVSIPKAQYARPHYEKLKCPKCNKRCKGDHELRRHFEAKHAINRKVWVCVDISPEKDYLSSCKHCVQQKQYGAYYNAAAHLRRCHFMKDKKKSKSKFEHKASNSGGDWPHMDTLKYWMKEVDVFVPGNMPDRDSENDSIDDTHLSDSNSHSTNTLHRTSMNVPMCSPTAAMLTPTGHEAPNVHLHNVAASAPATMSRLSQAYERDATAEKQAQRVNLELPQFDQVGNQDIGNPLMFNEFPMFDPNAFADWNERPGSSF